MTNLNKAIEFSKCFRENIDHFKRLNCDSDIIRFLDPPSMKFEPRFVDTVLLYLVRDGYDELVSVAHRNKSILKQALKTNKFAKQPENRRVFLRDYLSYFHLCKFLSLENIINVNFKSQLV